MIEAAIVPNGRPPIMDFLEELGRKRPNDLADVLIRFEDLARTGELVVPREMRDLVDGIWEIKTPQVRIPFFWLQEPRNSTSVRLTHGFMKGRWATSNGHAPRKEINRATWIRRMDLGL